MSSVKPEFIEHRGKKSFVHARACFSPFLANVEKMKFNKDIVKKFIDFFKFTKTFTKKTAVIGLDSIKKMLLESVLVISGRGKENISAFDGPNADAKAKDWLTLI